jgi:hypothetical protein
LEEPKDFPWMRKFWGNSKGIAEGRDGIAIGEGIGFDETGGRDIVEEKLVDEVRVVSWLNERTRVSDDERRNLEVLPVIGCLGQEGGHTVKTGITHLRAAGF